MHRSLQTSNREFNAARARIAVCAGLAQRQAQEALMRQARSREGRTLGRDGHGAERAQNEQATRSPP